MEKHRESQGETIFLRARQESSKKEKQEENQTELKFNILDLRIEHLGDFENLK